MDNLRCAQLDKFGRELIEAYRRVEDRDVFCSTTDLGTPSEVAVVHMLMVEHRSSCAICQQVARSIASAQLAEIRAEG